MSVILKGVTQTRRLEVPSGGEDGGSIWAVVDYDYIHYSGVVKVTRRTEEEAKRWCYEGPGSGHGYLVLEVPLPD